MSNHPSTTHGDAFTTAGIEWNDAAELHKTSDGGVFGSLSTIRRGTLAELIAFVLNLPEEQQVDYIIQKAGDRQFRLAEIRSLSRRADYPNKGN